MSTPPPRPARPSRPSGKPIVDRTRKPSEPKVEFPPLDPVDSIAENMGRTFTEPAPSTKTKDGSVKKTAGLEAKIAEALAATSLPFAIAGHQYPAMVIATRSPALATALAELARENRSIERMLERMMEGSSWGKLFFAVAGIVIPIGQYFGQLPGQDPFAMMYPAIENPRAKMVWTGHKDSPPSSPTRNPANSSPVASEDERPRVPGAPPGVVTVAATNAAHKGAGGGV